MVLTQSAPLREMAVTAHRSRAPRAALRALAVISAAVGCMAGCPTDMKEAPDVPGLSGVKVGEDSCVCPAGSYYWKSTGFIFCFDSTKSYSDHLSTQDDVAFRVTYGRAYDLVCEPSSRLCLSRVPLIVVCARVRRRSMGGTDIRSPSLGAPAQTRATLSTPR